jgi:hypothetical protein
VSPRAVSASVLCLIVLGVGGCRSERDTEGRSVTGPESKPCVTAPLRAVTTEADALPKGITLVTGAQLIESSTSARESTLSVEAPGSVAEAYDAYKGQLTAGGYSITKTDNEGREAELYFKGPGVGASVIRMATPACPPGAVRIVFTTIKA